MKVELCSFSGYKIYPGHGRRYARIDGKVFQFLNAKCESAFLSKRNPRQINWTVLYRRKHKKGQSVSLTPPALRILTHPDIPNLCLCNRSVKNSRILTP
ncbi:60S ribosomal protein L24 [Pimephales promelas]|nr:60S ribosomal protein L24 [Pimephales promelas]KAG1939315.1 60S ribosomal protein L24 [Pimephales promelas]